MAEIKLGTVVWFKGSYGFICEGDTKIDWFIHYTDIISNSFKTLKKGQKVSFEYGTNVRGEPKAINVTIIEEPPK